MNETLDMGSRLGTLASRLAETLSQEEQAISLVRDVVQTMLTAVREADSTGLAGGAAILQERILMAGELRQAQQRQISLFFRSAGAEGDSLDEVVTMLTAYPEVEEVREQVSSRLAALRDRAKETRLLVTAFEHALRFADQINHDLVYLLHGIIKPSAGRTYSARGKTEAQQNRRSLLNQVG